MALTAPKPRVRQTSTTTGTGTYSLDATIPDSYLGLVAEIGDTNTCHVLVTGNASNDWEWGTYTVGDATPDTIARTTVKRSTNSNAAVNWGAGTRTLSVIWPPDVTEMLALLGMGTGDSPTFTDLTLSGDDLTMATNTSGAALIADGTNFNPVVISGDISVNASGVAAIGSAVIVEADIADNAVTLAKMASGTDGNIISYDASGNPVAVATGNDGQVLTSTGAGSPPAFEDAGGGGSVAADDITIGDAAVLLSTSSGNITIDAAASDSDIIFKGTDGGADTTFATMDGSAAGHLILNNGSSTTTLGTSNYKAGLNAGAAIESGGNYNVLIGDNAGTAITTGDDNVAIGYNALDANTTGEDNVAVGTNALGANTDAEENTAVGRHALSVNETGDGNAAFGANALNGNTTGTLNVGVGLYAMTANTTGSSNVAIGRWAMVSNTTGSNNVAVGRQALNNNDTTGNSTAIGYQALYSSTGGDSVGLGYNAGYNLTTGYSCIFIGKDTNASAVDSTNQIVIGNGITGTANDQVSIGKASNIVSNDFGTDAVWSRASDVRKKKNIEDSALGLDFVNDLRPVTYEWKPNSEFPKDFAEYSEENHMTLGVTMHGLVAQEVKEALDKTGVERFAGWSEGPDGCQRISAEMYVFPLIKAIQELSEKVTELEEKLNG